MKIYKSLLLITTIVLSCSTYAETHPQSKLYIQKNDLNKLNEIEDNKVNFFELAKKNEPVLPTPNWDAPSMVNMSEHERSQYMSNMSQHERSQYLFNQSHNVYLNNSIKNKRIDTLKKARDSGAISHKQYQREVQSLRMYNQPKGPNSVGFSIPFE